MGKQIGENLHNLGIGKETSDITPKPWKRKEKKNQWIKTFCSVKDPMKRMKRQATKREKVSTSCIADKGLIFWIYEELSKMNS